MAKFKKKNVKERELRNKIKDKMRFQFEIEQCNMMDILFCFQELYQKQLDTGLRVA
jgi:hypothetical protein